MQERLAELNRKVGVNGSFVCGSEGQVLAQAMPESIRPEQIEQAAQLLHETFEASSISGQRVTEMDLQFGSGRLILRNLRWGVLVILCARNINVPLMNFRADTLAKKLSAELRPKSRPPGLTPRNGRGKEVPATPPAVTSEPASALQIDEVPATLPEPIPLPQPALNRDMPFPAWLVQFNNEGAEEAPALARESAPDPHSGGPLSKRLQRLNDQSIEAASASAVTHTEHQPRIEKAASLEEGKISADQEAVPKRSGSMKVPPVPPELFEQDREARRLIQSAAELRLTLRALGTIAVHWHCHNLHPWVRIPAQYLTLEFCGLEREAGPLLSRLPLLGYQPNQRFNTFYGNRRLTFDGRAAEFRVQIFLDVFEMYHRLNVTRYLRDEPYSLSPTLLFLTRLQTVDITEDQLRELSALCLDHELQSAGGVADKIDLAFIRDLCADDWGWFKTTQLNLTKLNSHAVTWLDSAERWKLKEWIQQLSQSIEQAPKSLRWRARARLGESTRWYQIPEQPSSLALSSVPIG